jgi:hypothetical protein
LTGSGSCEPTLAFGVPSIMSEKAIRTNDTVTFLYLSTTIPRLGKRNSHAIGSNSPALR